ncbi:MAG: SRPBCC domain-containing protein [Conexivisphaerales archaeon]
MTRKYGRIKQEMVFPASPEEIYDMLVDPAKHSEFTGFKAENEARVGGRFMAGDGYIIGKNIALRPGLRIVQEWKTKEWPDGYPPSILKITLRKEGDGTKMILEQTRVPSSQAEYYAKGWKEYYWKPLLSYLQSKRRDRSSVLNIKTE